MTAAHSNTVDYTPTGSHPIPVLTTVRGPRETTHGRLLDTPSSALTRTWCGKQFLTSRDPQRYRALLGVADVLAAVDCRSCRRSRPAAWKWGQP